MRRHDLAKLDPRWPAGYRACSYRSLCWFSVFLGEVSPENWEATCYGTRATAVEDIDSIRANNYKPLAEGKLCVWVPDAPGEAIRAILLGATYCGFAEAQAELEKLVELPPLDEQDSRRMALLYLAAEP